MQKDFASRALIKRSALHQSRHPRCQSDGHFSREIGRVRCLLARHLLAFADHAAEFYAADCNDSRRALELARVNIPNRPTLRAFEQRYVIALYGGDDSAASELLAAAKMRWGSTAAFRSVRRSRRMIDRRTLVSGSVLAAFVPTLRFMPASFETSETALAGSLVKIA